MHNYLKKTRGKEKITFDIHEHKFDFDFLDDQRPEKKPETFHEIDDILDELNS